MQIWIHDSKMKKIVALNNNIPEMLHYSNSAWHPYLDQATSTFDFTIPKFVNGKLHEDIKLITDECFVSFYINGSYQVFYIATLQEDDFNIQLTCNNTNLEYALEYANPFSIDSAQTIEWYLNHMDLLSFAAVEIGINEISDRMRTLTFDSQETKATRLQSLMSSFEAEYEFKVDLNRDGTYKRIVINIYQESDETHHGIGSVRGDVVLYYDNGLKGVQVNSDKTQMFNAGVFTGKDGLNLGNVEISEKNSDGIEEYYSRKGSVYLYAPLAMARYPATMRSEGQDNWIRKDFTTEYENVNDLKAYALRTLKQYAYPLMTYTASVQSNFIGQYTDLKLGDTVKIIDKNFAGGLALEARVSEMIISFDNPNNNSLVFTNYRKIDNKPTSALQSRIEKAVENRLPYTIELATTGGVTFKNQEGETVVTPMLYKGGKPVVANVTWRWALDGNVTTGMTYTVRGADVADTATLTVSAYIGNDEVATDDVSFVNVFDGAMGIPGTPGKDGRTPYVHTAWANNATGTSGFSLDDSTDKLYIGIYTDFEPADSTDPTKYNWTLIKGEKGDKGADGIPGKDGVGIKSTVITYGLSASDSTQPSTWTTTVPNLVKGQYLWTKTVWTYSDNTTETGYVKTYIAKDGNNGTDGIAGKDGVGIKSTSITYASSSSGTTAPTSGWSTSVPTVSPGMFLWTKTIWTYTDNTSETGYSVARMGTDGARGTPGPKGADGKTSYHHWAYSDNADGTGLTLTDNGQRYMGYYTDYTQADSTDNAKYRWADRWAKIPEDIQADIDSKADIEKVVYKTDISVTDEGIVHSASKTVNGQTIASMIAQRAEWVEIIARLLKVKGDMIVDGTIGANKLSVSTLSALVADLGQISGGSLELLESVAQGTSIDSWGSFTIPAHKSGLYIDNTGAISSGTPVRKSSSESVASDMPVAVLRSGQLRFARVDQNNDLGSVLHYGLSDPDNASINFTIESDGTKQLTIRANGKIVNRGTNYTDWISTGVAGVYYKRQGDVVALKMQVTTTANQVYNLGKIPVALLPIQNAGAMMRVTAWTADQSFGRNLQISGDGAMFLLLSNRGDTINTQVTWII